MGRGYQEALFLHGGPGLSSAIERLWFGDSLPVRWWDQPRAAATSFKTLLDTAAEELQGMASEGPVHLVAHSFGGQIAYALARDFPGLIRRITLLGCPPEPATGIVRLARRIAEVGGSRAVEEAAAAAEADMNAQNFQAMVLTAASDPAYPSVYFGPGSAPVRDRFITLMQQVAFLDMATFLGVMNEFLRAPPLTPLPGYDGDVVLLMGRHDPVISRESDTSAWRRAFPQAKLVTVETGHVIHLETPPDIWLPPQ